MLFSASVDAEPSSVTTPGQVTVRSGPAFATGGVLSNAARFDDVKRADAVTVAPMALMVKSNTPSIEAISRCGSSRMTMSERVPDVCRRVPGVML